MMREMTAQEFRHWIAIDAMEPIGRSRGDYAVAQLCHLVAMIMAGKKVAGDVDDWIPSWTWKDNRPKTGDEMASEMRDRLRPLLQKQQGGH